MKYNKSIIILCVIAMILIFIFIYSDSIFESNPESTVKNYLKEKVALYERREEIDEIFQVDIYEGFDENGFKKGDAEKLHQLLEEIRPYLSQKAYNASIINRQIISPELIEGEYSKVELEILQWLEKEKKDKRAIHIVEYGENFYEGKTHHRTIQITEEFTLEKIDDEWKITRIEPKSGKIFLELGN